MTAITFFYVDPTGQNRTPTYQIFNLQTGLAWDPTLVNTANTGIAGGWGPPEALTTQLTMSRVAKSGPTSSFVYATANSTAPTTPGQIVVYPTDPDGNSMTPIADNGDPGYGSVVGVVWNFAQRY